MHVCVLGAGGLGSVVGGCLAEAGSTVSLVARPAHAEAVNRDGLEITGLRGDRRVHHNLRAYADPAEVPGHIDLLLLTVKARDTAGAIAAAAPIGGRVALALSLQNATTKDVGLIDWLGADRVMGAATTEAGTLQAPGSVRHVATTPNSFYFGEHDGASSARVDHVVALFRAAGMSAAGTAVIQQVVWEKLLQIAAVAGFSASAIGFAPGGSFAHGIAVRPGAEHYVQIASELLGVYRGLGYEPRDFFAPFSAFRRLGSVDGDVAVHEAMALGASMLDAGFVGRPSLHEDIVRGKPTEVEDSLGAFVRAADDLGLDVPTARGAYRVVRMHEELALQRAAESTRDVKETTP